MQSLADLGLTTTDTIVSLPDLAIQLVIGILLALLVRWHFVRFGSSLSNRNELGLVFPFVLLTTLLVITIVKSSLALSLGLVGALSIVRFRTPIKEPEELAYLFLSIAIGLGLGANQTIVTIIAALFILVVMAVLKWRAQSTGYSKKLYLALTIEDSKGNPDLNQINALIEDELGWGDMRRFDTDGKRVDCTYFIDAATPHQLTALADKLTQRFEHMEMSVIDQPRIPGL